MSRSSAWLKLMISTREPGASCGTASCTGSECSVWTWAGSAAGNTPSRLSIQRTVKGKRRQQPRQRRAHVAAAEQGHGRQRARQVGAQRGRVGRARCGGSEGTTPPQHWPRLGPSGVAPHAVDRRAAPASQARASSRGLELELAAADGAGEPVGPHRHPGAGLARRRALGRFDAHQHAGLGAQRASNSSMALIPPVAQRVRGHGITAPMIFKQPTPQRLALAGAALATLWLAACGSSPTAPITRPVPGQISGATADPTEVAGRKPRPSSAATARDYRRDAARHVYDHNKTRIYDGKLPPMLYAVGTLQVHLDASGKVLSMNWMRAPRHAPEVIAEIERTVLEASPFPAAAQLGRVTWTDTWLWDKGGHFQLDTLTEGQL